MTILLGWCIAALLLPGIFAVPPLFAGSQQTLQFHHLGIDKGLSQSSVNGIVQDKRGFMWFATQDGLNRFDGYRFEIYKASPDDPEGLRDNNVTAICLDSLGGLWVGVWGGGLMRFDPLHKRFRHHLDDHEANLLIATLSADGLGNIWAGTPRGLLKFSMSDSSVATWHHLPEAQNSIADDRITVVMPDRAGRVWVGTENGLDVIESETGQISHFIHETESPGSLSSNHITCIYEDRTGTIWVGTRHGLNRWDAKQKAWRRYHLESDSETPANEDVRGVWQAHSGRLWVCTAAGVKILDSETRTIVENYHYEGGKATGLNSNNLISIYEDRAGGIWLGSQDAGVNYVNPNIKRFQHVNQFETNAGLNANDVRAFAEVGASEIWLGTSSGLYRFDPETVRILPVDKILTTPETPELRRIYALAAEDTCLWIGTENQGVFQFGFQSGSLRRYETHPENSRSLSSNRIRTIFRDSKNRIWIGTEWGLNCFDETTGEFQRFVQNPGTPNTLSDNDIRVIYETRAGQLWIGTRHGGLNRFDPASGTFTPFAGVPGDSSGLRDNRIFALNESADATLWIGTRGGGLTHFNPATGKAKHYTEKDGLPNNVIYGILSDDRGHLWISTNGGLSCFDPRREIFRNFTRTDGLQSKEFNFGGWFKRKNGEMLFGGINGFNIFHPDSILDNPYIPPVVLTDFRISNHSVPIGKDSDGRILLPQAITETDAIELSEHDNVFSFEFSALNYTFPEENNYAYKLEGFEREWNYIGNRHYATYTAIPPGKYTFRVIGCNNDGIWNQAGASIKILITPPFWKTWWFQLCMGLSVIAGFVLILKFRTRTMRAVSRQLESRVQERTEALDAANKEAQRRAAQSALIYNIGQRVSAKLDRDSLLSEIVNAIRDVFDYYAVFFMHLDEERGVLQRKAIACEEAFVWPDFAELKVGHGMIGTAARTGQTQISGDVHSNTHFVRHRDEETKSELSVPIKNGTKILGVLDIQSDQENAFDETDIYAIETLSMQIASALENARLYEQAQAEIVERKRAQDALKHTTQEADKANQAKSEFLANMSHEIRTPLNAIIGMTELVLETPLSAEQKSFIQTIEFSSETLLTLINDILDLSKIEAGQLELETIGVELRGLIEGVAEILSVRAHRQKVELTTFVAPELPAQFYGDPTRLRQILINLGNNAIKFTEEGEVAISITGESMDEGNAFKLHFSVADTGIGMSDADLSKIFNKFSQADVSTARKFGGTGLGLSISQSLVKLMRGKIWAESEPGKGSTFHFAMTLPVANQTASRSAPPPQQLSGLSVLVVDDHATNRLILEKIMTPLGIAVNSVENGSAALEHLRGANHHPDVLIVDMNMAEMNGLELITKIRQQSEYDNVRIMLLSSTDTCKPEVMAELNISESLRKPVKQALLTTTLARMAGKSESHAGQSVGETSGKENMNREQANILLVEDIAENQLLATKILEKAGYQVDLAENGGLAVEAARSNHYDVILMDIQMPEMDGFEATSRIRAREKELNLPRTPIIALTAHAFDGYRQKCLDAGMDEFVTKPIRKAVLLEKIRSIREQTPTILVVDDSPDNRQLLDVHLSNHTTYQKVFAKDGREAVDVFRSRPISMILMDMEMPVMNGYEATGNIRQLQNGKDVPIVALTAHLGPVEARKCLDAGCDDFLSKPLRRDDVIRIVTQFLVPKTDEPD